jgi:hypothetical protein
VVFGRLQAQNPVSPPVNDACDQAIVIRPGQTLTGLNNTLATVAGPETPGVQPTTCIQTLENDMWYSFTTIAEMDQYVVTIGHGMCSSPAGLQALLIRSDDCNAANYLYAGCSNLMATDTIKLFLRDTTPGHRYLIYVDGYEGTICDYSLSLKGRHSERVTIEDYKYIRFDYDTRSLPAWDPDGLAAEAGSNKVEIRWQGSNQDDVSFYVVEAMPRDYQPGSPAVGYASVLGIVPSQGNVAGEAPEYVYTLYPTSEQERDYCYRIVKVNTQGKKSFSEPFCVHLVPIKSFYVGEVQRGTTPGQYFVKYLNHIKKEDFNLVIVDAEEKEVKSTQLLDEPVRDGTVTINMAGFPNGTYFLRMSNRKGETYVRMFEVF